MMCGLCAVDLGNGKYCSFDELIFSDDPQIKLVFENILKDKQNTNDVATQ